MEKNTRALDHIADKEQKLHVIAKYLLERELKIETASGDQACFIRDVIKGTDHILVESFYASELKPGSQIRIFTVLTRYLELRCQVLKLVEGSRVELKVEKISIAKKERVSPRYTVVDDGFVKISNIVSSKTIIEASMFNIPTLVRVSFEEYQRKLSQDFGGNNFVSVSTFGSNLEHEFDVIKRTMKPIFIEDCYAEASYDTDDEAFLNYSEDVDDHLATVIKKYKDKQILSSLLLPIIYVNELDEAIPIGYVSILMKESRLTKERVLEIMSQTNQMVDRIKDANLMTTDEKFPVLDVSSTGLKIKVNHPNLSQTLPKQKGFVFDLFFKMQAPFRFSVKVAWTKKTEEGDVLLGLEFIGKGRTAADRQRFEENVDVVRQLGLSAA
ncbi:DUF1577 domain-containing protein [Leptospira ognonensis]|uniref:DUF1577 domain-containing protein n=1 Tax=Leptospira ognonensis TaxID=2484945 RepID=A0A4R9JXH2_9LEPT|nr:DUF1577 domain-containing protein [Leptospira ognonensis]TGL57891.1 DUF1577 domain-containing protein [Leptospira ognonensis]